MAEKVKRMLLLLFVDNVNLFCLAEKKELEER